MACKIKLTKKKTKKLKIDLQWNQQREREYIPGALVGGLVDTATTTTQQKISVRGDQKT